MSWFTTGYEDLAEHEKEKPWDDRGSKGPRRHWQPPETTNRLIFLDDDPTKFWEHNYKWNGTFKGNQEPCVTKNKLGPECPICDSGDKMWPYFVGMHSVVNMTPWFTKKDNREINFQREIFAAKLGGKERPGVLKKLERLKKKHGRLKGLVFDVFREGKLSEGCGDDFTLIEKVDPGEIEKYANAKLQEFLDRINDGVPEDKRVTMDKLLERNPWKPWNFEEIIQPRPIAELRSMFKRGGGDGGGNTTSNGSGGDDFAGGDDLDDDVPY